MWTRPWRRFCTSQTAFNTLVFIVSLRSCALWLKSIYRGMPKSASYINIPSFPESALREDCRRRRRRTSGSTRSVILAESSGASEACGVPKSRRPARKVRSFKAGFYGMSPPPMREDDKRFFYGNLATGEDLLAKSLEGEL